MPRKSTIERTAPTQCGDVCHEPKGYSRHLLRGEHACDDALDAHAAKYRVVMAIRAHGGDGSSVREVIDGPQQGDFVTLPPLANGTEVDVQGHTYAVENARLRYVR